MFFKNNYIYIINAKTHNYKLTTKFNQNFFVNNKLISSNIQAKRYSQSFYNIKF